MRMCFCSTLHNSDAASMQAAGWQSHSTKKVNFPQGSEGGTKSELGAQQAGGALPGHIRLLSDCGFSDGVLRSSSSHLPVPGRPKP